MTKKALPPIPQKEWLILALGAAIVIIVQISLWSAGYTNILINAIISFLLAGTLNYIAFGIKNKANKLIKALTGIIAALIALPLQIPTEIPIRLNWLTPVQHTEKMPEEFVRASEAYTKALKDYDKALEAYAKAREARDKASEAYAKALEKYKPQIEALHREEHPDCPWNGKTLFGDKEV